MVTPPLLICSPSPVERDSVPLMSCIVILLKRQITPTNSRRISTGSRAWPCLPVAGLLFTRINLDTFDDVLVGALADLDDLLGRAPVARGTAPGAGAANGAGAGAEGQQRRSDAVLMQLVSMLIFAAWNIGWAPPGHMAG